MSKIKVGIIFGGMSSEYAISLKSATSVINNIDKEKFEVVCIGITKKGHWLHYIGDTSHIESDNWSDDPDCIPSIVSPDRLQKGLLNIFQDHSISTTKLDCIFPVLHGKYCEDGSIQGLLELSGIPYVGCGVRASSSCMDKITTHIILDHHNIKTARWTYTTYSDIGNIDEFCKKVVDEYGLPLFVKPSNEGSSLGVSKVRDIHELKNAINLAFAHDRRVLIEEFIDGFELECAIVGNSDPTCSQVGCIKPSNEFYDYSAKYVDDKSKLIIPADISEELSKNLREIAIKAYKVLDCSGLSRIDFFLTKKGDIILNEINTIPGFTSISMYPKLFEYSGISYKNLITKLIMLAIERSDT